MYPYGYAGPEQCTTGEYWDEAVGECLCTPGLVPAPVVGGGCVSAPRPTGPSAPPAPPAGVQKAGMGGGASALLPWLLGAAVLGAAVLGGAVYMSRPKHARANPSGTGAVVGFVPGVIGGSLFYAATHEEKGSSTVSGWASTALIAGAIGSAAGYMLWSGGK